jgi:hypothetical protein
MVWPFVKAGRRSDPKITIMREMVLSELSVATPRPVVHAVGMAMIRNPLSGTLIQRNSSQPRQSENGPDLAPIHNRQVVVLHGSNWLAWLDLTRPESELLRPLPAECLTVEQVPSKCDGVDQPIWALRITARDRYSDRCWSWESGCRKHS